MPPKAIPASFWRGGTSRGLLFRAEHLAPYSPQIRDRVILTALGSPDPAGEHKRYRKRGDHGPADMRFGTQAGRSRDSEVESRRSVKPPSSACQARQRTCKGSLADCRESSGRTRGREMARHGMLCTGSLRSECGNQFSTGTSLSVVATREGAHFRHRSYG